MLGRIGPFLLPDAFGFGAGWWRGVFLGCPVRALSVHGISQSRLFYLLIYYN